MKQIYLQSCSGSFHFVEWNSLQGEPPCYQNQSKNKYFHPAQSTKLKKFKMKKTSEGKWTQNV